MDGVALLNEIVEILIGGITAMGTGIGQGLSSLATSIFLTGEGSAQTLSTFGVLVCVFAGISLTVGLSKLVCRWIGSLGGSKV